MLNVTENCVNENMNPSDFESLKLTESKKSGKVLPRLILIFTILILIIMFLPWTQNISSPGKITTLRPDQRPQTIHSVIPGRIEKWYVQEGDLIKKGDTILFLSEVKDSYFDPELLDKTKEQIESKESAVASYMDKVKALDKQIDGLFLISDLEVKKNKNILEQAKLQVTSDSVDLMAAKVNYDNAEEQYNRYKELYDKGLKSLTDLENREIKMQKALAYKISTDNKLLSSQNKVINAEIQLNSIRTKYQNQISKAESDKFTALSNMYDAEAVVTKMQNEYANYSVRSGLYYITAPQDGYVTKAIQSGLGETLKEGDEIVSIMPASYDLVVEMYIDPIDLPLIEKGQNVRIQFEGWPAIVFSGWPNTSVGTFGGIVYAIDNFISKNGKYRVLVEPDKNDEPWPGALRVGGATSNMLLLKDVPIWYELWRKLNGFPPDYVKSDNPEKSEKVKK